MVVTQNDSERVTTSRARVLGERSSLRESKGHYRHVHCPDSPVRDVMIFF